jgi:hypothetical protein
MSYTSIPNQPIIFNSQLPEVCEGCGTEFAQLADFNDQLFWQLEVGECGTVQFYQEFLFGDWTQSGSTITGTGNSGGYVASYKTYDVVRNWRITVTIDTYNSGTLAVGTLVGTTINLSAPGTHTFIVENYDQANGIIAFFFVGLAGDFFDGTFTVDSVESLANGWLFTGLVDAQTLAVVERFDPVLTLKDQYLTAAINLADYTIEPGCYRLAIADYCENTCGQHFIYNPFFNASPGCLTCPPVGWTSTPLIGADDWVLPGSGASISLTSLGNATELVSITELCEDKDYYVTIVVDSISNARLSFRVDGIQYDSAISTAGTYNFVFTNTQTGFVSLRAAQFGASLDGEITVSKITVLADKNWATYDKYSDLIQIGDFSDDCRFFKLEGCNAENQFGLAFNGTSFLPGIRLEGRRFRPQYNSDVDLFRYASGKAVTSYADIRKRVSFFFGQLPEYVFDFLSIITYFDNLYVNGDLYSPAEADFPDIEYNDANELGSITIDLYKKNDKVRKTVCTAADANCLPSILDLDSEPFILAQDGDRLLTQDNINLYQE